MSRNPFSLLSRPAIVCGALIPAMVLAFFWPLLFAPTQTLFSQHSDMLAMHLPMKHFLVQSFQETGEIPNWCSSSFAGMPFIHDVQLAAFYPFHWPLYLMPTGWMGAMISWLVVVHVVLAGWGMLLYGRQTGLSWHAAMVAATTWMFAGKWMLHLIEGGHSIVAPLALLPWVLCCLQQAVRGGVKVQVRLRWSALSGVLFGVMILGTHPQIMFYCGLGIAVSMIVSALVADDSGDARPSSISRIQRLRWPIGCGVLCAAIAVGCAAVQLMPALEATPLTSRAEGVPPSDTLSGGVRVLLNFFGPAIVAIKTSGRWEDRGGFAFLTVMLAAIAMNGFRVRPMVKRHLWIFGVLIAYSMGLAILFQFLPGFNLFRQATRMVLVAALPMAWLAGAGLDAIVRQHIDSKQLERTVKRVVAAGVLLCGGLAVRTWLSGETLLWHPYWLTLLITLPMGIWLLKRNASVDPSWLNQWGLKHAWVALVALDAAFIAAPSVSVKPQSAIYPKGEIARALRQECEVGDRILDRDANQDSYASPLGTGMPLALMQRLEPIRGYNSFDIAAYRKYLKRISGDDSPLRPFDDAWTFPLVGDFPLQDQMAANLLGIRYLVAPVWASFPDPWEVTQITEDNPSAYSVIEGGMVSSGAYQVWRNDQAFSKAWTVTAEKVQRDGDQFRLPAVLDKGVESVAAKSIVRYEPNEVVVDVSEDVAVSKDRMLVLTDAWFPGWECEVDGQPAEIHQVEGLFRGVWLTHDAKQVRFHFHPKSLDRGIKVSSLSLLVAITIILVPIRRRIKASASEGL